MEYIAGFVRDHGYPPKTVRISRKKWEIIYDYKDGNITYNSLYGGK